MTSLIRHKLEELMDMVDQAEAGETAKLWEDFKGRITMGMKELKRVARLSTKNQETQTETSVL